MSAEKELPSFCDLYYFHENLADDVLNQSDIDSHFHNSTFLTIPSPSFDFHESGKAPLNNLFQKSCPILTLQRQSSVLSPRGN